VREGFEKLDGGELDPFELHELIHRYKRSVQKLWSFAIERFRVRAGRVDGRAVARARRGGAGPVGGGRATPLTRLRLLGVRTDRITRQTM
jgi:hypothetical protein